MTASAVFTAIRRCGEEFCERGAVAQITASRRIQVLQTLS
jgi:hypothetical protein